MSLGWTMRPRMESGVETNRSVRFQPSRPADSIQNLIPRPASVSDTIRASTHSEEDPMKAPRVIGLGVRVCTLVFGAALCAPMTAAADTIRICVNPAGQPHVIGPSDSCRSQETLVTLNPQGLQGPPGPQGPQGPQ